MEGYETLVPITLASHGDNKTFFIRLMAPDYIIEGETYIIFGKKYKICKLTMIKETPSFSEYVFSTNKEVK